MSLQHFLPDAASSFFTCSFSMEPSPPLNIIGLIHSRRSPLAKRIPKDRAKPWVGKAKKEEIEVKKKKQLRRRQDTPQLRHTTSYLPVLALQTCFRSLKHHHWLQWPPAKEEQSWKDTPNHSPPMEGKNLPSNMSKRIEGLYFHAKSFSNFVLRGRIWKTRPTWDVEVTKAVPSCPCNHVSTLACALHVSDSPASTCGSTAERSDT